MSAIEEKRSGSLLQQWVVGDVRITKMVETENIIDMLTFFPKASAEALLAIPWLRPHFVTAEGQAIFSIHALVVETPTKRIIVDTCYGNDKDRMPWEFITNLQTSFLRDLEAAGFQRDSIDTVLCTHLHVDHVGWNTMLVDGRWMPTFPKARYILNKLEYDYWVAPVDVPTANAWNEIQRLTIADSVTPVFEAGLVDLVEGTYKVCDEVTLVPTPGHSPGHVSVRISSRGKEALITGDIAHHPSQLVYLDWGLDIDFNQEQAANTRRHVFSDVANRPILVIGTHWAGTTGGAIKRDGQSFRLEY